MSILQPSATAVGVAALRALYSELPPPAGIVHDPFAQRLLPAPLRIGLRLCQVPLVGQAVHRTVASISQGMSVNIPLRTVAIDHAVRDSLDSGAKQLVILGSGLDARAWRMPELSSTAVFELDRAQAHEYKRRRLRGSAPHPRHHSLVAMDFESMRLDKTLAAAGFDSQAPTIWLWEGVLVYLTLPAAIATLDAIAGLSATSSSLIATYTTPGLGGQAYRAQWRLAARLVGENVRGEQSTDELHERLRARGFDVVSDEGLEEWCQRFWPHDSTRYGTGWERLVVASKAAAEGGG